MSTIQKLETITGMLSLPLPVAAQILGISVNTLKKEMPVQRRSYRSVHVTVAAMREYITSKESTPKHIIKRP